MIEELIEILRRSGFDVCAEDIADILWLATHTEQGIAYRVQSSVEEIQEQETPSLAQKSMAKRPRRGKERQEPEDPPIESLADVYLHPPNSTSGSVAGKGGLAFRSPAAPALPNSLGIVRALRPLKQRIPSHTRTQLDERATVRQIAEQNIWFPVLKPVMQPWLDVALVIDEGTSMLPWRQAIHEFRLLLECLGAFRDVRIWGLVTDAEDQNLLLLTGKTFSRQHRQSHSPRELIDQSGLRLIFVITDCVSPAWYNTTASQMLNDWGKYHPVTLLQVLPQRLWLRTALGNNERVRLRTHIPGVANRKLQIQYISTHPTKLLTHMFPLPIVTLEPRAFSSWVKALFEMEEAWVPGTLFAVDTEQLEIQEKQNDETSINEIKETSSYSHAAALQYFKATASPLAYRLAQLLAATPISLPIARIVQRTMLPASQQVHLAEVFLSGLLEQITPEEEISDPDYTQYDFKEGVRAELLDSLSTITMVQVLRSISDFVENRSGHALDFRALLADPTSKGNITINELSQPFAQVGANVLRRLGGKYIALANRLQNEAKIASHEQPYPPYPRYTRLRQSVICPFCFYGFSPSEIRFRCMNPDCSGISPDPVYATSRGYRVVRMGRVLVPTRKLLSVGFPPCDACGIVSHTPLCPECHFELPHDIGQVDQRIIAIIGGRATGKSHYIASLIYRLQQETGQKFHFSVHMVGDNTQERWIRDFYTPLFIQKTVLPPTHLATVDSRVKVPLIFRITFEEARRKRVLNISFFDSAGEDMTSLSTMSIQNRYISHAAGIIFLLDPLQIPLIRSSLKVAMMPAIDPKASPENIVGNLCDLFEREHHLPANQKVKIPIAFTLSKIDTLDPILSPDSALRNYRDHPGYLNLDDIQSVSTEVASYMTHWINPNFCAVIDDKFAVYSYFGVSSLGEQPDPQNRLSAINSRRVEDPFLWLLYKLDLIKGKKGR